MSFTRITNEFTAELNNYSMEQAQTALNDWLGRLTEETEPTHIFTEETYQTFKQQVINEFNERVQDHRFRHCHDAIGVHWSFRNVIESVIEDHYAPIGYDEEDAGPIAFY